MSDKPRPWPNFAKDVRDRAAEAAVHGIREMEPLFKVGYKMSETERGMREAAGMIELQRIVRLLESVGACTRP